MATAHRRACSFRAAQAVFGANRASFIFVVRHPLSWALAASKWGCAGAVGYPAEHTFANASGAGTGPSPACVERLIGVWLAVHERLAELRATLNSSAVSAATRHAHAAIDACAAYSCSARDAPHTPHANSAQILSKARTLV